MDKYGCMMCGHIYDPAVGETKAFTTILCNTDRMEQYQCKIMSAAPIKAGTDFSKIPADWNARHAVTPSPITARWCPTRLPRCGQSTTEANPCRFTLFFSDWFIRPGGGGES